MTGQSPNNPIRNLMKATASVVRMVVRDFNRSETMVTIQFFARVLYFCSLKRSLRTLQAEAAFPVTIDHNLKMLRKKLNRMDLLIRPLSVLEQVDKAAKVLVIGPRNEWDLFLLKRAGFDFEQCTGLDLISYSPRIVLGDMHSIPFADGEFDVVLCGWTLSYSAEPAVACREISRVCKASGTIGLSVEYFSGSASEEREANGGYNIQDSRLRERVNSVAQLLQLFPRHGEVFWSHDAPLKRSLPKDPLPSNCAVLFANLAR